MSVITDNKGSLNKSTPIYAPNLAY